MIALTLPAAVVVAVEQALKFLPVVLTSAPAIAMLYSTSLQESRGVFRRQQGDGPARGLWQFEKGGGVKGVCMHSASRFWMSKLCEARSVPFTIDDVYGNLETDDVLAAGAARLLYFTDPAPLPAVEDAIGSWALYVRTWRPGKPKPDTWASAHDAAIEVLKKK